MEDSNEPRAQTTVAVQENRSPKHFRWTYEMETSFLALLSQEETLGNRIGGTFTPLAYRNILAELQLSFGANIQKNHLKNKIRLLKQQYSEFKDAFRGMSGFAWNWETKNFDAEPEVWDALIKENPSAAGLRGRSCMHWDSMNALWSSSRANGYTSASTREINRRRKEVLQGTEDGNQAHSENAPDCSTQRVPSGFASMAAAMSDADIGNASGSRPSTGSGRTLLKRKAAAEMSLQGVAVNLASTMEDVSRALVESSGELGKAINRCPEKTARLYSSLDALGLEEEYLYECFKYLDSNDVAANRFLAVPESKRLGMLHRLRKST